MHDIEMIRNSPEYFDREMKKRGFDVIANKILKLDRKKRQTITDLQVLREKKNAIVKKIAEIRSQGGDFNVLLQEAKKVSTEIKNLESLQNDTELHDLLSMLPNIADDVVPIGVDETSNVELRRYKRPKKFSFNPKPHYELGVEKGLMNFEDTSKISGARFVVTTGNLAKLERALVNFMLNLHNETFGYTEINHPCLVLDKAMYGVGQLPKFDKDSFKTTNGLRLIPTSEVFLTNLVADKVLSVDNLPLRFTSSSVCFRSEAGSAGRDTRGMIRQHQFNKVELVSITEPKDSKMELERMTGAAEEVLKLLDIPYRVVLLSTGDMGFSAKMTYDIEVWLPSQNMYREISSCSNCGDFQARRMKARYKDKNGKINFVQTLNGSALAVGRTVVAVMENYQNEDGSITIPEVLQPFMGVSLI